MSRSTAVKSCTPGQLATAIRKLPADPAVIRPGVWYRTQKEHWLGWLSEYRGPGAYGRKGYNYDARFAYNHIVNPFMLLWLVEACGVPRSRAKCARAAMEALVTKSYAQRAGAIRKCVPWEEVETALWG